MKLLTEFWPVLLFFLVYQLAGIYAATVAIIAAVATQVGLEWLRHRQVRRMQVVTLALLVVFGGMTLMLRDPRFIQLKPTVLQWLFAGAFAASHLIGDKVLVRRLLESQVTLPVRVWFRLNVAWVLFFLVSGWLNLFVADNYDEATWVQFKLFGLLGLTLLFVLAQAVYLAPFMSESHDPESDSGESG